MILWVPLLSLFALSLVSADLPSCERARCVHCEVEFISRMCPNACAGCSAPVQSQTLVDTRPAQPPAITQLPRNPVANQVPARQAGVQTQAYQQPQHVYRQQGVQPAQAFAAPQVQASYPVDTSTLAPLIEQPNADTLNPQLARRPADLAQPLPEYQNQFPAQQQNNYYQQGYQQGQQQSFVQPQQQAFGAQQAYQQPQQNAFGQLGGQQQNLFPGLGQQQSGLFNPFTPFLGQSGAAAFDPLGLFNFPGNAAFTQGAAPLARVAQPAPVPQLPQPQIQQVQAPRPQVYQQPQQIPAQPAAQQTAFTGNYNIPQQQTNQVAHPAPVYNQQQVQQVQQPYQNAQVAPSQVTVNVQQPAQYKTNTQAQPVQQQYIQQQQQNYAQQPPPQQPLPQTSNSIDAGASLYQKYVDGKGPAPAPAPAQCPRQPGWAPCISKDVANERFRNCCARLGDGCSALCNYDATLATMQLAVLTGRCPLNKVADMMVCASGYEDATACCEAYNVFEPGYEQCRPYCNPAAGLPQGGPLSDKYKCLVKLGAIQQCFYVSQKP